MRSTARVGGGDDQPLVEGEELLLLRQQPAEHRVLLLEQAAAGAHRAVGGGDRDRLVGDEQPYRRTLLAEDAPMCRAAPVVFAAR
jgi:hypothetical protein